VGYFNTTKAGVPVYIERLGKLDVPQLYTVTTQDRLLRWHVFAYEEMLLRKLPACTKAKGERVVQSLTILDLEGCSMSDLLDRDNHKFLGAITSIDQDNYPEMLHRMFIINAPSLFSMAWSVIKRFLDPKTREKISIHGHGPSSYMEELEEFVAKDQLPRFLGGEYDDTDWPRVQPGPWEIWQPEIAAPADLPQSGGEARGGADGNTGEELGGPTMGLPARTCIRQLGGRGSLFKLTYRRKKACDTQCLGEVRKPQPDPSDARANGGRERVSSSTRERSGSFEGLGKGAGPHPHMAYSSAWGAAYGLDTASTGGEEASRPATWEEAAREGDVEAIALLLADGVAPNYEGQIQVKLRGGFLPHWADLYVSVSGGVVVCRESEHSEDALAPASLLQALGVRLTRGHYVKVDGLLPNLELYHDVDQEALLWFTSMQCSLLLAYHAPQLATMTKEEQHAWWLDRLRNIEGLYQNKRLTAMQAVGGVASKAKSALQGLSRHFF